MQQVRIVWNKDSLHLIAMKSMQTEENNIQLFVTW